MSGLTARWRHLLRGATLVLAVAGWSTGAPAAADTILIENVGPESSAILIQDGSIAYRGALADLPAIAGARVVDAQGAHALPGLIDMHVHVWSEAELLAYLAHGVTTVRNMSGMPFHLRMAAAIEAGELDGPQLFTTGPILNSPGPNAQINHQMVLTAAEGRAAVRAQAEAGFRRIKVYSNIHAAAWEGGRAEAQARGLAITGHPPEGERREGMPEREPFDIAFASVLDAGFETIEHAESIHFHGLRDRWDPDAGEALAQAIAASGTPVTPTLVAHRNLVRVAESDGAFAERSAMRWLNPVTRQIEAGAVAFWAAQDPANERERAGHYAALTRMMRDAGVLLVAGSDAGIFANPPGESLFDELDLLVEAGLTPAQALDAATVNAAHALGEAGRLGCLAAGCVADLVFTACNARADLACLRTPVAVMRAGRWHDAAALADMRERARRHDAEAVARDLLDGMAAQGTPLDPAMLGL